jgi:hypothetical protein
MDWKLMEDGFNQIKKVFKKRKKNNNKNNKIHFDINNINKELNEHRIQSNLNENDQFIDVISKFLEDHSQEMIELKKKFLNMKSKVI